MARGWNFWSATPHPPPPSPPHPLPASLTVSPELSPRRGLHSFGWRQALGASQISAPPTSPPPLLCFFPVVAGMGGLSLPQFHKGEGGRSRLSDEESTNRSLYLFNGLQSMRMVAALCAHAGERSRSLVLLVGLPGLSLRGVAIEGSGQ